MSLIVLIIWALSMSLDAFSVAIAKGMATRDMTFAKALRQGLVFGLVEAIAPILGWVMGRLAQQWMQSVDHWIGFILLSALGVRCIYEGLTGEPSAESSSQTGIWLFVTAIATSIDATVAGVSLAFLEVNIWLAAALIGAATTIMATLGLILGQRLGAHFGNRAMILGGLMLIAIGTYILYSHLTG